jgi:hypothetical protein
MKESLLPLSSKALDDVYQKGTLSDDAPVGRGHKR